MLEINSKNLYAMSKLEFFTSTSKLELSVDSSEFFSIKAMKRNGFDEMASQSDTSELLLKNTYPRRKQNEKRK